MPCFKSKMSNNAAILQADSALQIACWMKQHWYLCYSTLIGMARRCYIKIVISIWFKCCNGFDVSALKSVSVGDYAPDCHKLKPDS